MFENSGMPPHVFMREVLIQYHQNKMTIREMADFYGVSMATITRIIDMYELNGDVLTKLPGKGGLDELADAARAEKEKITDDDLSDLRIDLGLFERGKMPDEQNGEEEQ